MSFAEVLKQVKSLSYETIVFDTAPTGHTLRFLQFPSVLEKALAKVSQLSSQYGPLLNGFLGAGGQLPNGQNLNDMMQLDNSNDIFSDLNVNFGQQNQQAGQSLMGDAGQQQNAEEDIFAGLDMGDLDQDFDFS